MPFSDIEKRRKWRREYMKRKRISGEALKWEKASDERLRANSTKLRRSMDLPRAKRLGISYEKFKELEAKGCALCGKQERETDGRRILRADHNHKTGEGRGILCNGCNTKLGWYENNADKISAYLAGKLTLNFDLI